MTFVALFTSWQFWLLIALNTFLSTIGGIGLIALMQANGPDEVEPHISDASIDLLGALEDAKRLHDEVNALKVINADLIQQLDALNPGLADYAPELEHGPKHAV